MMKRSQFRIGSVFYTASGAWIVTDVGTRVVVAVEKETFDAWSGGPPYGFVERVFDLSEGGYYASIEEYVENFGPPPPVRPVQALAHFLLRRGAARNSFWSSQMTRKSTDVDALLQHVVQIGHVPGPREVAFVAKGAMPYVADWDWLRVALNEVLGLVLPASVVKEVEKVLRGNRLLARRLPVIVRTNGFQIHGIELVPSRRAKRARVSQRGRK